MKAYKGFNKDMTCTPFGGHSFQYEEGKTYHVDEAELCKSGFHACENPLDCFSYYSPANSVYHEVELEDVTDEKSDDSKRCGKTIKIGARLTFAKIVELSIDYVKSKCSNQTNNSGDYSVSNSLGDCSVSNNSGYRSVSNNSGYYSVSNSSGDCSVSNNSGYYSVSNNSGDYSVSNSSGNYSVSNSSGDCSVSNSSGNCSVSNNSGYRSVSNNSGYYSVSNNSGYRSVSNNSGYYSVSNSSGNYSVSNNSGNYSKSEVSGKDSIAVGAGYQNKAKACLGSAICLCERGVWNGNTHPLLAVKAAIVDGKTLKPDTWYKLENGVFIECEDGEKE